MEKSGPLENTTDSVWVTYLTNYSPSVFEDVIYPHWNNNRINMWPALKDLHWYVPVALEEQRDGEIRDTAAPSIIWLLLFSVHILSELNWIIKLSTFSCLHITCCINMVKLAYIFYASGNMALIQI